MTTFDFPVLPGAACRGYPEPLWDDTVPVEYTGHEAPGSRARRHRAAKAICETCPVQQQCRTEADRLAAQAEWAYQLPTGIWGGELRTVEIVPPKPADKLCDWCGNPFTPKHAGHRFCSTGCRKDDEREPGISRRLDPVLIQAVLEGRRKASELSGRERAAAVRRLVEAGWSKDRIAAELGVIPRSVWRIQQRLREETTPKVDPT